MPMIRRLIEGRHERGLKRLPPLKGTNTAADVQVTPERALQVSAVYSCVRILAETGSMLPVGMFEQAAGARRRVVDHPMAPLLTYQANPELSAGEFWAQMLGWKLLRGNGLAYIQRDRGGRPIGLWPIAWTSVEPRRQQDDGRLVYKITLADDEWAPITEPEGLVRSENVLHFRAFGTGGAEGLSPVGMARQAVGTSFAATSYIGGFFARDASPGGIVSVPGKLDDGQYERLTRQWQDLHEGFDKSHQLAVMEGGARWEKTTLSPADAQFLEVYRMTRADISGIYGVPPHMIGDVDRSTSWGSGIEQQSLGYVIYSLMPWLTRLERVTNLRLGDPSLYVKFNPAALLRGDTAQRFTSYAQARQWGWMSVNDIREKEDEEPVEGGDQYLQPLNMVPAGTSAPPQQRTGRPRLARAAADVPGGAAMVALYPPADVAEQLAVVGGLPAEELHVTLAYLGTELTNAQRAAAATVVASAAAQHDLLAGAVAGLGRFPDSGDGVPYFATVDVPRLAELRHRLVDALEAAGVPVAADHGFTPHMTLTYAQEGEDAPEPIEPVDVVFDELALSIGGERFRYGFSGTRSGRPVPHRRAEATEAPAADDLPAWVQRHYEQLAEFFAAQSERALAALNLRPGATAAEILDEAAENEELTAVLLTLARGLVTQVAQASAGALGGYFTAEEVIAYLAAGAAATAANINATTIVGIAQALGAADAAAEIAGMFEEMTQARARQLANARVNWGANFGTHEGAKQAGARTKTWRVGSSNPRSTHAAADGQTVGIREEFTIGTHRGRWPHDYRLGVDEIAGCTCRLEFTL